MNKKIRDILFLLICIGAAFRWVPILFYSGFYHKTIGFIGGESGFASKLMFIPLLAGIIYTIYCYWIKKDKSVLVISRKVIIFAAVYLGLLIISVAWGSIHFPFIDQVLHGPADQFRNIDKAKAIVDGFGVHVSEGSFLLFYIAIKTIKNSVFEFIWQFGGVFLIYCWYRNDKKRLIQIFTIGVTAVVTLECFVTIIEALEMAGNRRALHILAKLTPLFHPIDENLAGGRLWWSGQFRGTFTEPSYFGMFCAFALPFLWYQFIHHEDMRIKVFYGLLSLDMAFDIFMTSSRTAIGLFMAEVVLLLILGLTMRNKYLIVMVGLTFVLNLAGLGLGNFYMGHLMTPRMREIATVVLNNSGNNKIQPKTQPKTQPKVQPKTQPKVQPKVQPKKSQPKPNQPIKENRNSQNQPAIEQSTLRGYVERNLFSLTDVNKRSNRSRFTIVLTNIRIGLDHPVLGVGSGLRQPYIGQYLKGQKLNNELKKWLKIQKERGALTGAFPNLGDYAVHFAEGGILGLISFLVIPLVLLVRLAKGVIREKNFLYGIVLISLLGSMAVGLGDSLTILYVYWLLLGAGYALTAKSNDSHNVENK